MIKLGITGGIGSGKSTVCQVFALLGIPIYDSDKQAKLLMNRSPIIRQKLMESFGKTIYQEDGTLNRKQLASLVFNSPPLLQQLNEIVHPVVKKDFMCWADSQNSAPYAIQESAILFDSGFHLLMDKTLTVTAPLEERINRVMKRDKTNRQQVQERIDSQMSDEKRLEMSDYEIKNGNQDLIIAVVLKLDKILRNG